MGFISMQKYTFVHASLSISSHISKVREKNCHQIKWWLRSHLWDNHAPHVLDKSFYVYYKVTASFGSSKISFSASNKPSKLKLWQKSGYFLAQLLPPKTPLCLAPFLIKFHLKLIRILMLL